MPSEWLLKFRSLSARSDFSEQCADSADGADRSPFRVTLRDRSTFQRANGTKDTIGAHIVKKIQGVTTAPTQKLNFRSRQLCPAMTLRLSLWHLVGSAGGAAARSAEAAHKP
jgi:hypothetical protein